MIKRYIILLALVVSAAFEACAQLRFGIDLGVGLNQLTLSKSIINTNNRYGFYVGPKIHAKVPGLGLGVDATVRYAQKNVSFDDILGTTVHTYDRDKMHYVQLPVNLRWDFGLKGFGIYIATGPQWDWHIGQSEWTEDGAFQATFERNTISWNIGAGVYLFNRIQVGISHNMPISRQGTFISTAYNTISQRVEEIKLKNNYWELSLDIYF